MSKKRKKNENIAGKVISVLYGLVTVVLLLQLFLMDKLPLLYLGIVCFVFVTIAVLLISLQMAKKISKTNKTLGKVLMVLLSILLVVANVYIYSTNQALSEISGDETKKTEVSIVVMQDSPIESIEDLVGKKVGQITIGETENVAKAIGEIEEETKSSLNLSNYHSFDRFGNALYENEVDAIVLNEAFRGMFEEKHPNFEAETRVIKTYSYVEKNEDIRNEVQDITENPFTVYITGIDQRGTIGVRGRSDVNKVMTVHPKTHEILLIDIPRDYYIPQVCQANQYDKLTHTGIFGPDCTVQSMANFMGIDINYYVRVNFSSLEQIVDALGGITVYSKYTFNAGGYQFYADQPNELNGAAALAFCRERYSLPNGDGDRIMNQSLVLSAMISKMTSPSIITNYLGFMNSISGTFQTNMSDDEINRLIKMQLSDMSGWNITSYGVNGTGGTDWTPANGFNAYVNYPNMDSVYEAVRRIEAVKNGEILSAQE